MSSRPLLSRDPILPAALALAALLTGCTEPSGPADEHFPEAALTTVTSDDGAFFLEVRTAPEQPPSRGSSDVELTITDAKGAPRDDLLITVVPWMPDMGHGSSKDPTTTPIGEGRYVVSDVGMFMAGRWELLTEIAGPVDDSATIAFQIP